MCKQFDELVIYRWLETDQNSENIQFIQHHIVRSAGTMIIHLCLPLIYLFGYSYFALVVDASFDTIDDLIDTYPPFYYCVILATLLVISAFTLVYYWSLESWKFHPFVKKVCTIFLLWGSYWACYIFYSFNHFFPLPRFSPTLESWMGDSGRISWILIDRYEKFGPI